MMGKAADNERIKLLATWNNNVSAGLTIAGVFVPILSFGATTIPLQSHWLWVNPFTESDVKKIVALLATSAIAFLAAFILRRSANTIIQKIQD